MTRISTSVAHDLIRISDKETSLVYISIRMDSVSIVRMVYTRSHLIACMSQYRISLFDVFQLNFVRARWRVVATVGSAVMAHQIHTGQGGSER